MKKNMRLKKTKKQTTLQCTHLIRNTRSPQTLPVFPSEKEDENFGLTSALVASSRNKTSDKGIPILAMDLNVSLCLSPDLLPVKMPFALMSTQVVI